MKPPRDGEGKVSLKKEMETIYNWNMNGNGYSKYFSLNEF